MENAPYDYSPITERLPLEVLEHIASRSLTTSDEIAAHYLAHAEKHRASIARHAPSAARAA